jgi:hypothetical protein
MVVGKLRDNTNAWEILQKMDEADEAMRDLIIEASSSLSPGRRKAARYLVRRILARVREKAS